MGEEKAKLEDFNDGSCRKMPEAKDSVAEKGRKNRFLRRGTVDFSHGLKTGREQDFSGGGRYLRARGRGGQWIRVLEASSNPGTAEIFKDQRMRPLAHVRIETRRVSVDVALATTYVWLAGRWHAGAGPLQCVLRRISVDPLRLFSITWALGTASASQTSCSD
ncbi:hypothetical protein ACLOJK_021426 [Asimina triloba]